MSFRSCLGNFNEIIWNLEVSWRRPRWREDFHTFSAAYCHLSHFFSKEQAPCYAMFKKSTSYFSSSSLPSLVIFCEQFQYLSHNIPDGCQVITSDPNALSGSSLLRLCRLVRLVRIIKAGPSWIHPQTTCPIYNMIVFIGLIVFRIPY